MFVTRRNFGIKEKVFNEIWYQTALEKADKENLEGARFYWSKKMKKKAIAGLKENLIFNFCESHNNERIKFEFFTKLKRACDASKARYELGMNVWRDL